VSENGTSIAVITPQGGAISQLLVNDFEIVPKFSLSEPLSHVYGHVLAPWPNRLADGSYLFESEHHAFEELDQQNNKNHGLVLDRAFEAHGTENLVLGYRFGSDRAYPFDIDLEIHYTLTDSGLEVSATATNFGDRAPFAIGFHPYLLTGEKFTLVMAATHKSIQNERLLPIATQEIPGLALNQDSVELQTLDHCFEGADSVVITRPEGEIIIEAIENLPYFMMYRPQAALSSAGPLLAVEPQSAVANAFNQDIESVILESGERKSFRFGIRKL